MAICFFACMEGTDSHASDIGHWLGMTAFCVYRAGRRGRHPLHPAADRIFVGAGVLDGPQKNAQIYSLVIASQCSYWRRITGFSQRKRYPFYCAFSRTGNTIYRKLSPPSTGVITQGEMLVFSAMQTLSAGA